MANVEGGGIWGFIKRIFSRKAEQEIAKQATQEKKPQVSKEEKKEKKERAQEIIQELDRVTPSHPAHEILQGVQFDKKTIADHPELGNLLLDIVHTVNTDPNKYHDSRWLQDKLRRLNTFVNALASAPNEADKIRGLEENIERLYRTSQKDRLETAVDEDIRKLKESEMTPDQEQPQLQTSGSSQSAFNLEWGQIINSLPQEIQTAKGELDRVTGEDKEQKFRDLSSKIEKYKKNTIIEISKNPTNPGNIKAYQDLQRAQDRLAADFVKSNPSEGGRLYEIGRRGAVNEQQVEKLIQSDENYRDYWFYHILENILYNRRMDPHMQLYQLYESGDMNIFLDIVRRIKDENGSPIGQKLADRYVVLRNTIFQSHDFDFYCAHPQQDLKEFIGSTALFLNEYIDASMQDPMVSLAKRLYESQLLHIRESHGGYVPREYLQWNEGKLSASKLDEDVERLLKQAIAAGQLYNTKIDPITGLPAPSMWNRKQIDPSKPYTLKDLYGEIETTEGKKMIPGQSEDWRRQLGELKIASALKQAKGLSLVDQRMLEIIGKSKGTGTKYVGKSGDPWGVSAFNSVPYEGIVRYLEPVIHYYGRYGLGMDISNAFFNMMVSDRPNWNWDPIHMRHLIPLFLDGKKKEAEDYAKAHGLGDIESRLYAMDNPFGYSGMWGTMTKWRVGDVSAGFDDWEKDQAYAAAVKLTNIGDVFSAPERESTFQKWDRTWAFEKAKRYFIEVENKDVYQQCRKEYRDFLKDPTNEIRFREMAQRDEQIKGSDETKFDPEFEFYWRTQGERRYRKKLDEKWTSQLEMHNGVPGHPKKGSEFHKLVQRLERAYKARVWVQTTMRAPLIIARELEVDVSKHGEIGKKGALRKRIIWELLGIDLDELELLGGKINITPTAIQEAQFDRITDVEGALSSLQQAAIRENRDLKDDDFQKAIDAVSDLNTGDPKLKRNFEFARNYWHMVKKAMLGNNDALEIYKKLGIKDADKDLPRGVRFHDIDWDKIKAIDITKESRLNDDQFIIPELRTDLLNNATIDRNYRHLFSTEDMGWEFLNVGALGSRNPVRRAGDLGSHVQFAQLFEKYLIDYVQRPNPQMDKMVEALHEMWGALSGDFDYVASDALGRIAYSTGMIFKKADWAWKSPFGTGALLSLIMDHSVAQMIHGRDRATAWGPNEMLQWVQGVGSHILPKTRYSKLSGEEVMPQAEWTRGLLGKRLGGTKTNATYEILNMTVFIATMIMLYRAITAKSEEEED